MITTYNSDVKTRNLNTDPSRYWLISIESITMSFFRVRNENGSGKQASIFEYTLNIASR